MLNENFIILGALIQFFGSLSYLTGTVKGKIQPNKISWFLWSLAPLIAFTAEIKQGVGLQSLTTFMVGFMPLLIFIASFANKKAYWKLGKFDIACGVLSILGLILWSITRIGNIAIIFSILADGLAALPTIVKAYRKPESENYLIYLTAIIGSGITLLTIQVWTIAQYAFPLYILFIDVVIVVAIKGRIRSFFK